MDEQAPLPSARLEMAPDGDAPEGVLTSADDHRMPFSGWTGLAAAIEEWRQRERTSRPTPPPGKA
jgi:hypothetical protein